MDKDLKRIVKALEDQGFEVRVSRKGHVLVERNGAIIAVFAGTASDWRSVKNGIARARRHGFIWPPKR